MLRGRRRTIGGRAGAKVLAILLLYFRGETRLRLHRRGIWRVVEEGLPATATPLPGGFESNGGEALNLMGASRRGIGAK